MLFNSSALFYCNKNDSDDDDDNDGKLNWNFISVFECTVVNLATYRQFTAGCLRLNYSKKKLKQIKTKHKTKQNKKNPNFIKSGLSQFLFLQHKMKYVDLMATFIK